MTRLLRLPLAALGALALLVTGCAEAQAAAATVNGTRIERSDFQDQLEAIRDDQDLSNVLEQVLLRGQVPIAGEGDSVDAEFSAIWLTQLIQSEVLLQAAQDDGLEVTDSVRSIAERLAAQQYAPVAPDGSTDVAAFEEYPEVFRDAAVDQLVALVLQVVPSGDEPVELACARHVLVSTQPDPLTGEAPDADAALAEAEAIRDRLAAGEDFAQVAAEESDDPGSAQQGGELGCLPPGVTVPEFDEVLFGLEPGELSELVTTEFGFHLIEITEQIDEPFSELDAEQAEIYVTARLQQLDTAPIVELFDDADVAVDSAYGEWVVDEAGARVQPPAPTEVEERPATEPPAEPEAELPEGLVPPEGGAGEPVPEAPPQAPPEG